jgi:plasmid stabilization system protein ParE
MRVVITAAATTPTWAVSFSEELLDRCQALADIPRANPLMPRYESYGICRCVHGNYLIFLPPPAGAD